MTRFMSLPLGGEARLRRAMIAPVSFQEQERILEMCCGTGGATVFIARKAKETTEIIGMDLSSGQLKRARKRTYDCETRFVEGDVSNASFLNDSFDKVFITHAIHEMPREMRLRALSEARRVLRKQGEVVVLELDNPPNIVVRAAVGFWALYWLPGNFETPTRRDLMKHGLVNEVKESGFVNVRKYPSHHGIFQTVIGTRG
ncbi:class I SAM-dependent methyltransferase [Candidatus Poribacteria bacterium]